MNSAACIGCGACVASCKNASAALFTGAKVSHSGPAPAGEGGAEGTCRARMVAQMDGEGLRGLFQYERLPGGVPGRY